MGEEQLARRRASEVAYLQRQQALRQQEEEERCEHGRLWESLPMEQEKAQIDHYQFPEMSVDSEKPSNKRSVKKSKKPRRRNRLWESLTMKPGKAKIDHCESAEMSLDDENPSNNSSVEQSKKPRRRKVTVIVEDASDSEYEDDKLDSIWRNRRPSPGQWMEPVE